MARWQFITPPNVPTATKSRCLVFPDSLEWQALINGFVGQGTDPQMWQQLPGGITPDEAVEACVAILNGFFEADECAGVQGLIIGEVRTFGFSTPPEGWLECNGDSVAIDDYPELFAVIGENFGFSVGGNFVLPDMRYRASVGLGVLSDDPGYEIGLGMRLGQAEIGLDNPSYIPAHTHTITDPGHVHPPLSPSTNFVTSGSGSNTAAAGSQLPLRATTGSAVTGITVNSTGAGAPFPIIQPVIGLLTCIYAGGVVEP